MRFNEAGHPTRSFSSNYYIVFYSIIYWTQLHITMKNLIIAKIMSESHHGSLKLLSFRSLLHISFGRERNWKCCEIAKDHLQGRCATVVWFLYWDVKLKTLKEG